jgi:hypothetical protein
MIKAALDETKVSHIDKQLAQEFRDRWQVVNSIEILEQRAAPLTLRWQQLNSLIGMAMGLGIFQPGLDKKEDEVSRRWLKLKGIQ